MSTQETNNDAKRLGGYIKEKFAIGISRITDDEVVRAVVKVTSHKLKVPNEKHLERLVKATHGQYNAGKKEYEDVTGWIVQELEPHTHSRNWVVVLKTLIVFHTLLNLGSEDARHKIAQRRTAFNTTHMKDLADSPDGAQQEGFIHAYARYLEERCVALIACKTQSKIESEEFVNHFLELSPSGASSIAVALMLQLEVMLDVELREEALNNHATLHAFKLIVADGKRLYVVLTKRIAKMLDAFTSYSTQDKQAWLALFKRYQVASKKLADLFMRMNNNSNIDFGEALPRLQPMPDGIIVQLENAILDGEVQVSRVPGRADSAEADEGRRSPELFKKKPTRASTSPSPSPQAAASPIPVSSPASLASPAAAAAAPAAPSAPQPQKPDPFGNLFDGPAPAPRGSSPALQAGTTQVAHAVTPTTTSSAAAGKKDDMFDTLFAPAPARGPTSAPSTTTAPKPAGASDFDPFAAAAPAQPSWGSGQPQQQQQQQRSSPPPASSGPVDFFSTGASSQQAQPQRNANASGASRGSTAADSQLDFFADSQQKGNSRNRAW